jgi:ribokinase
MIFDIVSIGNINIDLSFHLGRMPNVDAEVFSDDFMLSHGGSAANLAFAAGRLGLKVAMLGCVGDDPLGKEGVAELEGAGVDCTNVKRVKGARTGTVCVLVDRKGHRSMIAFRGANENLASALDAGIPEAKIVHLSNVSRAVLRKVLGAHRSRSISLDPGGGVVEIGIGSLEGLDILLLNEQEFAALTGLPLEGGTELLANKVNTVVIKRGKEGVYSAKGAERFRQPSFDVRVVDTTGAGDSFDAGFLLGILEGREMQECLGFGQAVAAMKIGGLGARSNLPSKEKLIRFLEGHGLEK